MKATNKNLAQFYGISHNTIGSYSKDSKKKRVYQALRNEFERCSEEEQQISNEKLQQMKKDSIV